MTGLQQFIMELQKVVDTGNPAWNSTYEFARGIGIKQERERIIKIIEELGVINGDHKFFIIQAIKGEQK